MKDPIKQVEIMERFHLSHDLLTEIRKQLNVIEKEFFSLIGEEIGELTVLSRCDRTVTIDDATHYIPAWKCHCTCGAMVVVDHEKLINKTQTFCEGETHE